ncbi:DUF2798 domain-containing protein [Rhizobium alvei]|uniref:DUF2798 domain-containing protein n=1 Tax=Rhizobium alvei TaxID=1132659 RepID=A0ABT8YGF7_9HYPH|nr:DUF2798 domain-containing protein [Rhizobium alvei]MDO6962742.1 DUF2798 domain-containing protein [Rhizobium alvei]
MVQKRTMIIAQILITGMMALIMSGIMSMIAIGPNEIWLKAWPHQFIIAWPIAFIVTQFVGRFGFFLAGKMTGAQAH